MKEIVFFVSGAFFGAIATDAMPDDGGIYFSVFKSILHWIRSV